MPLMAELKAVAAAPVQMPLLTPPAETPKEVGQSRYRRRKRKRSRRVPSRHRRLTRPRC
jgi:hypothetical protein